MRKLYLFLIISISILLTGCGGDEPISENELKTNELRSKYADKIVGSWWQERIDENDKAFEQLNFSADRRHSYRIHQMAASKKGDGWR